MLVVLNFSDPFMPLSLIFLNPTNASDIVVKGYGLVHFSSIDLDAWHLTELESWLEFHPGISGDSVVFEWDSSFVEHHPNWLSS
jgi:hypothetical protein